MATAVFIDITDVYYKLLKKYGNGKLNYKAYLDSTKDKFPEVVESFAYGCQENNEASSFIGYLRSIGFFTKYKKPYILKIENNNVKRCNWLVGVTIDIIKALENPAIDTIVLGSANPDTIPLIKFLQSKDIKIIVYACNIPNSLLKLTDCIEIEPELLEVKI